MITIEQREKLTTAVETVRSTLIRLSDVERLDLLAEIFAGYCKRCGEYVGDHLCYCWRDE